ncbi:MAG: helix-turn-helix transcriptional regulator [Candidatus Bipolaricaulota bacterium]|nr:MAG: helix-turn-helix transcriptional regulator [Candidatus Bipolaricaulota bacterium]
MAMESFAVRFPVLGFLLEEPQHGYVLRERIAAGLGGFWRVASSQLYSVLHRLEHEGWVTAEQRPDGAGPERTVYTATGDGVSAFWAWCGAPVDHLRDLRVELFAKLYFIRRLRPAEAEAFLERQRSALVTLRDGVEQSPAVPCDDPDVARWARDYRRRQIQGAIDWADALLAASAGRVDG